MSSKRFKKWIFKLLYEQEVIPYKPSHIILPEKLLTDKPTAWKGLESIIEDIIRRFELKTDLCVEFGVEFGYSAVAFSNYFNKVIGVDTFMGDTHTNFKGDHYTETSKRLEAFTNIELVQADYQTFTQQNPTLHADLIHVDIVHDYEHTFACGLWSAQHSKCTIFHDTETFIDVRKAVRDVAKATGKRFYNYPNHCGLGIVV
jgi:hypothetical protein